MEASSSSLTYVNRERIDLSDGRATIYTSTVHPFTTPIERATDLPFSSQPAPPSTHSLLCSDPVSDAEEASSTLGDVLDDIQSPPPASHTPMALLGIEDISDSQWHEATVVKEKRLGERSSGQRTAGKNRSSSMASPRPNLTVDRSDSPTQGTIIKTPRALSPDSDLVPDSDPIEWPTSSIASPRRRSSSKRVVSESEGENDEEDETVGKRSSPSKRRKVVPSPRGVDVDGEMPATEDVDFGDDMAGVFDLPYSHDLEDDGNRDGLPLDAAEEASEPRHSGPSLTDLFADDDDAGPPPRRPSPDRYDLTNDDADEYDWDDFPLPDLTDLSLPGPSTSPIRRRPAQAEPEFFSSPANPPPVPHPIMLITDLPEDAQDFYRNHWRRGANKAGPKKAKRVERDDEGDESGGESWSEVEEGEFGVKMSARPAPGKFRGRGGKFRGGARGRARFRGRGKGRK